jgi:hypothetical protein
VSDYRIFSDIAAMPKKDVKIYHDRGTLEWDYDLPLSDVLVQKGYVYGVDDVYYEVKNAGHNVIDWIARIHYPLILFKGPESKAIVGFQTALEVIKSVTVEGKYFQRLNPVVTLDNGMRYSAAQFASYQLLNPADGEVRRDGSFEFTSTNNLTVKISYQGITDSVVVNYDEVQRMK